MTTKSSVALRIGALGLAMLSSELLAQGMAQLCPANNRPDSWNNCFGQFHDIGSGTIYSGKFMKGTFNGFGTLFSPDGTYSGEFRNGKFEGQGVLLLNDGTRFVGGWRDGLMEGAGRAINADGREVAGKFSRGNLIENVAQTVAQAPARQAEPPPRQTALVQQQTPRVEQNAQPRTPANPTPAPPPAAAPARTVNIPTQATASGSLDGIYLMTQMMGMSLFITTYQILGNKIAERPTRVMNNQNFSVQFASRVGTFRIAGDRFLYRWEGDAQETSSNFKAGSNCPNFIGGITCRVRTFRNGETIAGTFSGTIGNANVSNSIRLRLNRDGTYKMTSTGMVNAPDTGAISNGDENGRYQITSNSSIIFLPNSGERRESLIFPYPSKDPSSIWLGSRQLKGRFE